jgi:hypothetical protein
MSQLSSSSLVNNPWLTSLLLFASLLLTPLAHATDTVTYYHLDAQGTPVAATDEQGNVIWREDYQPTADALIKTPPPIPTPAGTLATPMTRPRG